MTAAFVDAAIPITANARLALMSFFIGSSLFMLRFIFS
jgi:hypothetical protein